MIIDIQGLTQEISTLIAAYLQEQAGQLQTTLAALLVQAIEAALTAQAAETAALENLQAIIAFLAQLDGNAILEQWKQFKELLETNPEEALAIFTEQLNAVLAQLFEKAQGYIAEISERIDAKGIEMYAYINNAVMTNEWGFDLLRTADGGKSFEVITRTGFDDKYNYGCPSFLSTEEGLYFGTCNPFYGGQLFLLSEEEATGINEIKGEDAKPTATGYYTLSGQAVNGTPTRPGVYIKDGRKVIKH